MANNAASFAGPLAAGIINPTASKIASSLNYLNFHGTNGSNWSQQYLPELYEQEVERYGNRSISSFLRMVGAEMPMASDQVIWSEQGRLHLAYNGVMDTNEGTIGTITNVDTGASETHAVRIGNTLVIKIDDGTNAPEIHKGLVTAVTSTTITVKAYGAATFDALGSLADVTNATVNFFVYGSEFDKGTGSMTDAITPGFKSFTARPIIIKDHYEVNGSDAAQIGWVEVSGEAGQTGYLWYLKAEGDTRTRFEDYLEMALVEAEEAEGSSGVDGEGLQGTEGLFDAIKARGLEATDMFEAAETGAETLSDFDLLLKELDKQGSIEENMLFLDRSSNLHVDDMLAGLNPHTTGGLSFGVFENSEDMALNLGFSGFRRGSYDFYKTDWKYLNDASTRGHVGGVQGILVPAGTSSVYDQVLGKNIRRPFLHVRYRASEADDRRMKSWVTGSVGGAATTGDDKMEVHYLSERCLVTQAANNFILFSATLS